MALSRKYSPCLLLGVIFLLMLALAGVIEISGSDMAGRMLVMLIPFGAVILGTISVIEAESTFEIVLPIILILSGFATTTLAVISASPFSNLIVDVAIIGSIIELRFIQPLQTTIQTTQQFVN